MADTVEQLNTLRTEIHELAAQNQPRITSTAFTSWQSRTRSTLSKVLGPDHHITIGFVALRWLPTATISVPGRPAQDWHTGPFRNAANAAEGYLEAAAFELVGAGGQSGVFDASGVDTELWAFISTDVNGEHWGKAASQTTLFLEDRIRKWSGESAEVVGVHLMTAVLGPSGNYRIGRTDGEKDGWHQFARGIVMALRNAAAHRIEDRPDHRRYVLGVIGSCSLLLTQLRYEHGTRFADVSPVEHGDELT